MKLVLRGLLVGICAGAGLGFADTLRALFSARELVQSKDAVPVVLFYAACFAPLGLAAALVARLTSRPLRALHLLVLAGSVFFFAGAWANVTLLPGFTAATSLAADVALAVLLALWFRNRWRGSAEDRLPLSAWIVAGALSTAAALAVALLVPSRDDGPVPQARTAPGARRPNVLLYLCDTLRADHLGCYGYAKATSPEIDAFAKDATLFEDCRAVTSWTKPSVASLFTSLYPTAHACVEQRQILMPQAETVAEVFRAAGWRTAAFVDNPFVSPEFGFGQGFDEYEYVHPSVVVNGTLLGKALFMTRLLSLVGKPLGVGERVERGAKDLHARFLDFVRRKSAAPWFAYVHAMEPHLPYEPARADAEAMGFPAGAPYLTPPFYNGILPFERAPDPTGDTLPMLLAQYDGEIRGFSRGFGTLVDELRRGRELEDTIVVFIADHGEEFHEHGGWTHGQSLHRELTQVPLIVRLPDALGAASASSRRRRVGGVATLLDVVPTLVDLCGIRHPAGDLRRCGASLVPQLLAPPDVPVAVPDRELFGEVTVGPVGLRSIRSGRWQLVVAHELSREASALYDDVSDPQHGNDRSGEEPVVVSDLRRRLDDAFHVLSDAALESGTRDLDPDTAARLRRLGYVGGK